MESGEQSFPRCASLPCGGKCVAPLAVGRRVSQGAAWRSPSGKMCRAPWRQGTETLVSHVEDFFPFPRSKRKEKGKEAPTTSPALGRAVRAGEGAERPLLAPVSSGSGGRPARPVPSLRGRQSWTGRFTSLLQIPGEGSGHKSSAL